LLLLAAEAADMMLVRVLALVVLNQVRLLM
jgi:hypothetical protein